MPAVQLWAIEWLDCIVRLTPSPQHLLIAGLSWVLDKRLPAGYSQYSVGGLTLRRDLAAGLGCPTGMPCTQYIGKAVVQKIDNLL